MNDTTNARAEALDQITFLTNKRAMLAENWASLGTKRTDQLCGEISDEIADLYEYLDALESGEDA